MAGVLNSQQDKVSNEPAETESDSGDSLFVTQQPVPEPVRSRRERHPSLRSDPASARDSEESEGSSSSHEEPKPVKRKRKYRLPKYSFSFLTERRSTVLPNHLNKKLHNSTMGGFFKCVQELWLGYDSGDDVERKYISPLSEGEGEEERAECEDIRVVGKKCLLAAFKAKSRGTWCNQGEQQRRKDADARQEKSQGGRQKMVSMSLDTESTDGEESSCSVLGGSDRNGKHATSVAQKRTSETRKRNSLQSRKTLQEAVEEELSSDSDAVICEPRKLRRRPRQCTQADREATQSQTAALHIDDLSEAAVSEDEPESQTLPHIYHDLTSDANDSVCNDSAVRKGKKKHREHEIIEDETGQSQEEPEGLRAAKRVNAGGEDAPSPSEENTAEPPASQTHDELECNERNCTEASTHDDTVVRQEEVFKQKKKKRKKSAAENIRQEVDGYLDSHVSMEETALSWSCNVENGVEEEEEEGKKKKKKKKRCDEDAELLQPSATAESLNNAAEKKKKRKKEEMIVAAEACEEEGASTRTIDLPLMSTGQSEGSGNGLENNGSEETLDSSSAKRKKHKRKQQPSSNDAAEDGEEGVDMCVSNDAVSLEESAEVSLKKKKKKSKRVISEDSVAQSDDSVSLQKKKKKKKRTSSFLAADVEEKDAQTHAEQSFPSPPVDARVWGADEAAVSAGEFVTESAETAGNLGEWNDGERKKKKKKKRKMSAEQESVEKDHDSEEPMETFQSALPETIHAGAKKKKKRRRSESELSAPADESKSAGDGSRSATDEDGQLKKKKKRKRSPLVATDGIESEHCSSVSHKKKGKRQRREDVSRASDPASEETLTEHASASPGTPVDQTLNDRTDKKKKKKMKSSDDALPQGKPSELEPQETNKKRNKQSADITSSSPALSETSLPKCETSSSNRVVKNKVKRRLLNPSEQFLSEYSV